MRAPAVRVRDLRYRYRGGERDILRIGALDVDGPGLLAVTGPTGVGKTTLMELLAGTLREPYQGSIRVLGVELRDLRRDRDRQCHLRRIGLIPQDFGLLAGCTVAEILHRDLADAQIPLGEHPARVARALDQVGLLAFAGRMSEQLSGGQRQRVAIARTLARDVELMIADEPTANLDPAQADSILDLFERLSADRPVVVVTHDPRVAARCVRHLELRPLCQAVPAATAGALPAAARPHPAVTLAGALVLAVAVAASTLAVRATNAHRTASGGAAVALHAPGAVPEPRRAAAVAPARPGAPLAPVAPGGPASPSGPGGTVTRIVPVVRVVDPTAPGPQPAGPTAPQPPPVASAPTAPPLPAPPTPAPPTAPPAPAPPPPVPSFAIAGHEYPVCVGAPCASSFVHDVDWSPNVPSYADADGSILGNAHGLPTGLEVDYWNGTSLVRLQVLASTTVLNWGRPGPTGPPPGTVMELGGVDQANACMDATCPAPYYYTYVFLAAATSAAG